MDDAFVSFSSPGTPRGSPRPFRRSTSKRSGFLQDARASDVERSFSIHGLEIAHRRRRGADNDEAFFFQWSSKSRTRRQPRARRSERGASCSSFSTRPRWSRVASRLPRTGRAVGRSTARPPRRRLRRRAPRERRTRRRARRTKRKGCETGAPEIPLGLFFLGSSGSADDQNATVRGHGGAAIVSDGRGFGPRSRRDAAVSRARSCVVLATSETEKTTARGCVRATNVIPF